MKFRHVMVWSLASVLLGGAVGAQTKTASVEQTIAAQEQKWLESQRTNNTALLEPLLADKVVETTTEGKLLVGKATVVADAKATTWSSADYTDVKVWVFGDDTAIATGLFTGKGKDAAGKAIEEHVRFTDTWVKMSSGQWLCVATHDSTIKK
jgi:ketosteroid isomerase-like protein